MNFLFAITPLFVGNLIDLSSFSISFYRFFGAAIIEFVMILLVILRIKKKLKETHSNISFFNLIKEIFRSYYLSSNKQFLNGGKQILYLIVVGILLINLSAPFYFLSFNVSGLVVSTIFVNSSALLLIAFVNWIKKEERIDILKIVDLMLLIAAIFTIAFSNYEISGTNLSFEGILIILIVIIAYTTFLIIIGRDSSANIDLIKDIQYSEMNKKEELDRILLILKALMKLCAIHLFGSLILIPFSGIISIIFPNSIVGNSTQQFLFDDLPNIFNLFFTPNVIALVVVCTVLPYFLLVYSGLIWPKNALKQDMWASIFALIDPLIGLYIGYLIWKESIKPDYIIFTTLFLLTGIIVRYFHEVSNAQRVIFIVKLKKNQSKSFLKYIEKIKEIDQINCVIGLYDFVLFITVRSMTRLLQISNRINYFSGLDYAYYSLFDRKYKKYKT